MKIVLSIEDEKSKQEKSLSIDELLQDEYDKTLPDDHSLPIPAPLNTLPCFNSKPANHNQIHQQK